MNAPLAKCEVCDSDLMPDARFCQSCGAPTPTGEGSGTADADDDSRPEDTREAAFRARLERALGPEHEISEVIGKGGFAYVYRARDVRLDRQVAIKVIRPDLAGATAFLDRFRRESVALAKLRHPGVVPIYDIREADGLIYYFMPFVEGVTLGKKLKRHGRLPPVMTHRILSELADATAAAHRAGIVHRDIKPDNVILEGNLEKVLLVDFGIAKAVSEDEEGLTARGVLMGTPHYMSPEQAAGAEEIDHRADLYALGVLAYHMLTGRVPFDGTTTQQIIVQHMTEPPVPVRDVNPSIPKALGDAVMRCLAKDPWDRFPTAMDLWRALQAVSFLPAETELGSARPVFPRRLVLAAAALVGLATGVIGDRAVTALATRAPPEPPTSADVETFVRSWMEGIARIAEAPAAAGAERTTVLSAFDSVGTVLRVVQGQVPGVLEMSPVEFLQNGMALGELGEFTTETFDVRSYGDIWVVSGFDGSRDTACRTFSVSLRFVRPSWRVVRVTLASSC